MYYYYYYYMKNKFIAAAAQGYWTNTQHCMFLI
jgi:hypothetical protein